MEGRIRARRLLTSGTPGCVASGQSAHISGLQFPRECVTPKRLSRSNTRASARPVPATMAYKCRMCTSHIECPGADSLISLCLGLQ